MKISHRGFAPLHNSRRLKTKNKMFVKAVAMVFASKIQGRSRNGTIFAILLTLYNVGAS
jgi:hypothetical protein